MERQCPECGAPRPLAEPHQRPGCGVCPAGDAPEGIPFDDPLRAGFLRSLGQTWHAASFNPRRFFLRIPSSPSLVWPLLYAALCVTLAALANAAIQQPLLTRLLAFLPYRPRVLMEVFRTSPEAMVLLPVGLLGAVLLMAAACHLGLFVVGARRPAFAVTLRTACYGCSTFAAWLAPLAGWLIQPIWWTVLLIVGLAQAHAAETWRSAFAVLLPTVACCGLSAAAYMMLAALLLRGLGVE